MTVLYSKQSCAPCRTLKQILKNKGIEYIEKDVSIPEFMDELRSKYNAFSVPVTVINDEPIIGPNISLIMQKLTSVV